MMQWIAAVFLVVGFVFLIKRFKLLGKTRDVVSISRHSMEVIRHPGLSDEIKEAKLQQDAKKLFRLFFILLFGGAAAILLPIGMVWLASLIHLVSLELVFDVVLSLPFIIAGSLFAVLFFIFGPRSDQKSDYSPLDRFLHRVAFETYLAQIPLADTENLVFSKQLAECTIDRPIFITALPRAGTTLLLECCARLPDFAAHCYRDMPFVLTPCFWNRFSALFKQSRESRERAHGDGMMINLDSPEALEEVLWKTFWRSHYHKDRIMPWQRGEENSDFEEFFRSHMRKIMLLRRGEQASEARYISKNNGNIARVSLLRRLFPDSVIIVPFRDPLDHTSSLLEQHRNFLRIHAEDRFASEYMRGIGHFDFGQNLRPVDFDGWLDNRVSTDAENLIFWLEYWVAGYRHLFTEDSDNVHFFNYQILCENPDRGLNMLADITATRHRDALLSAASGIRPAKVREVNTKTIPASLLHDVDDLHMKLQKAAKAGSGLK
jgi:hypothetical protein